MRWNWCVRWMAMGSALALVVWGCTPEDDPEEGPMGPGPAETPPGVGFPGVDARVNALAVYADQLYAGGEFLTAGTGPDSVFHVAAWNGSDWSPLAGGVIDDPGIVRGEEDFGEVSALAAFNDQLIVGGRFDTAGETPAANIARWDGTAWSTFQQGGPNGPITSMTTNGMDLVVGGDFSSIGGANTRDVGAFDGTSWRSLGTGIGTALTDAEVNAITVFEGQIVAGGSFTVAGDTLANNVAQWTGTRWRPLAAGLDGSVLSLATFQDRLYASGLFDQANGIFGTNVVTEAGEGGEWVDVAIDRAGEPRIAYYAGGALHYARRIDGDWVSELVDDASDVGQYCSIALTEAGAPAIAYYDATNRDLKYAIGGGAGWTTQTVRANGDVGTWCSLVLGANEMANIAYYHADSTTALYVARQTGPVSWTFDLVDAGINIDDPSQGGAFDVGRSADLTKDSFGALHVAYYDADQRAVRYARRTGSTWALPEYAEFTPTGTDLTRRYGDYLSLAIDDGGLAHLVFTEYRGDASTSERLLYASRTMAPDPMSNEDWGFPEFVESPITVGRKVGRHPSLVIDVDGVPHVSYADVTRGHVRYAYRAGIGDWRRLSLDASMVGQYTALALEDGEFPRVAYYDQGQDRVKLAALGFPDAIRRIACWDGTSWSELGQGLNWWARTMVVSGGGLVVGGAFSEAGGVSANRLARWDGSAWATVADGLNGDVWALALFEGRLYAAGAFTRFGSRVANYIVDLGS